MGYAWRARPGVRARLNHALGAGTCIWRVESRLYQGLTLGVEMNDLRNTGDAREIKLGDWSDNPRGERLAIAY